MEKITIHSLYEGNYAEHGVEFTRVRFTVPAGTDPVRLELQLRDLPGCRELLDFYYNAATGEGGFDLLGADVALGDYPLTAPARYVLEVDGSFEFNGVRWGQCFTHIETEPGQTLCGAERGGKVTGTGSVKNVPVNCPHCRDIWRRCQAWGPGDFGERDRVLDAPLKANAGGEARPVEAARKFRTTSGKGARGRTMWWKLPLVLLLIFVCIEGGSRALFPNDKLRDGLLLNCGCMPG